MKFFIDSAEIKEIKKAFDWGVADGVTTNPSLLKKAVEKRRQGGEELDIKQYLSSVLEAAKGTPVSLEVTELSSEGMISQGEKLYETFNPIGKNVNIKVPVNPAFKDEDATQFDGIKAVRALSEKGIPVNCTLIFTPEQALVAAKAGAAYVSPFAGRIDDLIRQNAGIEFEKTGYYPMEGTEGCEGVNEDNGVVSGIDLVAQCVQILQSYGLETEVIAASLRNPRQVREAALVGAEIATIPFKVIGDMLKHEKTCEGMQCFTRDIVPEYAELAK